MQIYIADLQAYNSGYLKGEWIKLPTEEDDIQDAILRQSQNVQSDFAIHDWELPFEISEYTNPLKINELCHTIQELNLNKYLIQHLEYAYGVDLKNTDTYTLKNYLEDVNPDCSIEDISANTGISTKNIHRLFCSDDFANFNFNNGPKMEL